jgi:hypothetical protein
MDRTEADLLLREAADGYLAEANVTNHMNREYMKALEDFYGMQGSYHDRVRNMVRQVLDEQGSCVVAFPAHAHIFGAALEHSERGADGMAIEVVLKFIEAYRHERDQLRKDRTPERRDHYERAMAAWALVQETNAHRSWWKRLWIRR